MWTWGGEQPGGNLSSRAQIDRIAGSKFGSAAVKTSWWWNESQRLPIVGELKVKLHHEEVAFLEESYVPQRVIERQ